jgi:hypothetical protein
MGGCILLFFMKIYFFSTRIVIPEPATPIKTASSSVLNLSVLRHFILQWKALKGSQKTKPLINVIPV